MIYGQEEAVLSPARKLEREQKNKSGGIKRAPADALCGLASRPGLEIGASTSP